MPLTSKVLNFKHIFMQYSLSLIFYFFLPAEILTIKVHHNTLSTAALYKHKY
jgi:hypothetical protein